jgi:hypothetical protein
LSFQTWSSLKIHLQDSWESVKSTITFNKASTWYKSAYLPVFIFDWDDTLLFTTYLKGKQNTELTLETKKQLFELDNIVCKILDFALQKGTVFIITNAFTAWVDFSSKMYLPEVHKKIESSKKIMTLSAR